MSKMTRGQIQDLVGKFAVENPNTALPSSPTRRRSSRSS